MIKLLTAPNRLLLSLLVCTASFTLCGCIESSGPLIDPASAVVDTKLLGVWGATDKDGDISTVTFGRGKIKGQMTADTVDTDADKTKPVQKQHYVFVVSTINARRYISDITDYNSPKPQESYEVLRYRIRGKSLDLCLGDSDVLKRLTDAGRIRGKGNTAQAASLAQYLAKNSGDDLFPAKTAATFSRQADAGRKSSHK